MHFVFETTKEYVLQPEVIEKISQVVVDKFNSEHADNAVLNKLNAEFIPISKRTIHDIQVELSGSLSYNEIMRKIDKSVADIPQRDIVQITLSGEVTEETEIEPDSYVSTIENNFFYVRIKDKTELKIDYEKYKNDISLKGEFIRLVNQNNGLSDEEKAKVIMTGIKALAGRLN